MRPTLTTLRTVSSGAPRGVCPAGLQEPTRSLLRHRLIDLERRLVDRPRVEVQAPLLARR